MPDITPGVNPDGSQPSTVTPPVTTTPAEQAPKGTDAAVIAENLKKAMQAEREQRKEAERLLKEKEEEIALLKSQTPATPTTPNAQNSDLTAKVEVLTLIQKDTFVRDNLGLIEEVMLSNPTFDVHRAVDRAKGMILEALQKGNPAGTTPPNIPPKTITPGATPENPSPKLSGNKLQDAAEGKLSGIPAEMREAINRVRH